MENSHATYSSLLIIVLLAVFIPVLINKIKFVPIPLVVGEIIAGMIVGKSGLNIIHTNSWLEFLSTFGFVFLMFLSGLEIDFDLLSNNSTSKKNNWLKSPPVLGLAIFMFTLLLAGLFSFLFFSLGWIKNIPLMTLIMSTTSLGIVVPILKERGLLSTNYGQTLLFSALIADFATMVLITIFVTLYVSGFSYKILFILLLFLIFFIFYRLGLRLVRLKIFEELSHATSQLEVRGTFALILVFIALTQKLGVEIILGAFLAGVIIALIRENDLSQLNIKLDAIGYGFFIPIFFINIGAGFDIHSVISEKETLYLLGALLIGSYIVKLIPSLLLKLNFSWRETIGGGLLLSSRLSLIIAASAISLELGAITESVNSAVILVAIITCTFSPLLFNPFVKKENKKQSNKIYVIGINERSLLLAQRLNQLSFELILVSKYQERYDKARETFPKVFLGDYLDVEWLKSTGVEEARTVIISTLTEETNTELCRICNKIFNIDHLLLLTNSQNEPYGAKLYGALYVSPELATIFMAENMVTNPQTFRLLSHTDEACDVSEIRLNNSLYYNKPLRKIKLPGDTLILSIIRNAEKIIPHGNTVLMENDILMIVGSCDCIKQAHYLLNTQS